MYVFRQTPGSDFEGRWIPGSRTLCEMTAREFAEVTGPNPPTWAKGFTFRRSSPEGARDWVARGGHHETPLYRGWDRSGRERILYARG